MVAFSLNDRIDDGKTGADDHPRQCRARRCLGYVGQDAALDKTLTGREMLHLHGTPYHLSRDSTQHRVVEPDAPAVLEAPTAPSPWAPACWCWLAWRDCYFSPSVPSCAGGWVDAATTVGALVAVWGNPHRQRPDFSNGNRVSPSMLEPVAAPLSMTLDQLLTLAVSFFTASIVLALWRASTATGSTSR